jgi:DNA-binding winged helix-turn-helix (wHTH) protein
VRVAFGACVLDTEARELLREGRRVHLAPQAFRLLEALLARRPRALSRAEIHDLLWPRTFVAASSLGRVMAEVREAIGDDARAGALVRTVHGFGYAFCGEVTEAGAGAAAGPAVACRLLWGGREVDLPVGEHVLGRVPGSALWIEAPGVSRRHARVRVAADGATLEDLGSKNGTFLRGRSIAGPAALADGDTIGLGTVLLTVRLLRAGGSTDTLSGGGRPRSTDC